jgi:hypothetical protein
MNAGGGALALPQAAPCLPRSRTIWLSDAKDDVWEDTHQFCSGCRNWSREDTLVLFV